MSARDVIARACCRDPDECVMGAGSISTAGTSSFECYQRAWEQQLPRANAILSTLTAAGYRLIGPGSVDDVAAAMWQEEAIDSGTPASIAAGRTREAFDEQADGLKDKWRKFAAAALRSLQGGDDGR